MRKNKAWLLFLGHKIRPEPDYIKVKPYPIANVLSRGTDMLFILLWEYSQLIQSLVGSFPEMLHGDGNIFLKIVLSGNLYRFFLRILFHIL